MENFTPESIEKALEELKRYRRAVENERVGDYGDIGALVTVIDHLEVEK